MRLLKIEWLKLKKYRTFYILSGLFLLMFFLLNYSADESLLKIGEGKDNISFISSDYAFPKIWDNIGYYFGWSILFITVFVVVYTCNEFRFKTQRQNIIDGQSRMDFLNGKALLILAINISLTILYTLTATIWGTLEAGGLPFTQPEKILYVFVYGLNYLSFAFFLGLLIRKSGLAIMILFLLVFLENVISGIINGVWGLHVGRFLPLQSSDGLFPFPFNTVLKKALQQDQAQDKNFIIMLIVSLAYVAIYYLIARWRMRRADL